MNTETISKINDIKKKLNEENDDEIVTLEVVKNEENTTIISEPVLEIIKPFTKKKLNRNDVIKCENCHRFVRRDGFNKHLLSDMCLIDNQRKKTIIDDILKDKFNKYEGLYIQYCIEHRSRELKVLFKKMKKLYEFMSDKVFNSRNIDDYFKEHLIDELFTLDYSLSKEHIRHFKK